MKENSIEEDIILLKDFTESNFKRDKLENYKGSYKMGYFYYKDIQQAIEHILSDYKRVLKENEQLRTEVNSLKKENEDLHKEIERMKSLDIYKLVEDWETGQLIPVQKIKAKIEELDIEISTCEYDDDDSEEYKQEVEKNKAELLMAKKVLQQLLEEGVIDK